MKDYTLVDEASERAVEGAEVDEKAEAGIV